MVLVLICCTTNMIPHILIEIHCRSIESVYMSTAELTLWITLWTIPSTKGPYNIPYVANIYKWVPSVEWIVPLWGNLCPLSKTRLTKVLLTLNCKCHWNVLNLDSKWTLVSNIALHHVDCLNMLAFACGKGIIKINIVHIECG